MALAAHLYGNHGMVGNGNGTPRNCTSERVFENLPRYIGHARLIFGSGIVMSVAEGVTQG